MENKATNIVWHDRMVTREDFESRNRHKGTVVWFTGLSASGKSTIAVGVEKILYDMGAQVYVLDGDNVRHGLNKNLGFSPEDREENIRRIGEVSNLFAEGGTIVLTAFISPYRKDRDAARAIAGEGSFVEVHVQADIDTCIERDPKGLYQKAIKGEIPQFTGISAPYEEPLTPELTIDTGSLSLEDSVRKLIDYLIEAKFIDQLVLE